MRRRRVRYDPCLPRLAVTPKSQTGIGGRCCSMIWSRITGQSRHGKAIIRTDAGYRRALEFFGGRRADLPSRAAAHKSWRPRCTLSIKTSPAHPATAQPRAAYWWIRYWDADGREHSEKVGPKALARKRYMRHKTETRPRSFPPMRAMIKPRGVSPSRNRYRSSAVLTVRRAAAPV